MAKIDKEQAELILISGVIGAIASEILRYCLTAPLNSTTPIEGTLIIEYLARLGLGIFLIFLIGSIILDELKNHDIIDKEDWEKNEKHTQV